MTPARPGRGVPLGGHPDRLKRPVSGRPNRSDARPLPVAAGTAEAGFSLLEILVTLAVLAIGLALAAGILVQTQRMLAQGVAEVRAPEAALVVAHVRADLQAAAGIGGGAGAGRSPWSRDRLVLLGTTGEAVVYERREDRLVRFGGVTDRRFRTAGEGRTVLPGLISWRWKADSRLVTVELIYDRPEVARWALVSPRAAGPVAGRRQWSTERVSAAMRGGGLGWGW